jgi:hypothetical protein
LEERERELEIYELELEIRPLERGEESELRAAEQKRFGT